ncbi:MAG: type II secretion system F family protein [Myxococcota bacterium]|jgi:tight adherence protein B|nr:type II secretion system F family protein [Myxococcota bacterium]
MDLGFVLFATAVFFAVLSAFSMLYWGLRAFRDAKRKELAWRLGTLQPAEANEPLFRRANEDRAELALGSIGRLLQAEIHQADAPFSVERLVVNMTAAGAVGFFVMATIGNGPVTLTGFTAGLIPWLRLRRQAIERARTLSLQLPDALDLLGRTLRASHGFNEGLRTCARELPSPLAEELGRVYEEHHLGRDLRDCLEQLADRNPRNFDLRLFVSAVLLQKETGGNLVEILDNISHTVRERFIFHARVKALTSEVRLSATVLALLPILVATAICTMQPGYLQPLLEDPLGISLLTGAGGAFGIGLAFIHKLTREVQV